HRRLDLRESNLLGLEGEQGRLPLRDRLQDDALLGRRGTAFGIRIGFEGQVVIWLPLLDDIGAGADQRGGDLVAQFLRRLLGDEAARGVADADGEDRGRRILEEEAAGILAGDLDMIESSPVVGIGYLLAVIARLESLVAEFHV